mmetsp:Transcript_15688/g.47310  ORF Transcript_15688/g.47310 Transcript_15688/m.47310 type:complete len:275 (+) Transcript_15688:318-1142(+)
MHAAHCAGGVTQDVGVLGLRCGSHFMNRLKMTCHRLRFISSRHSPSLVAYMPAAATSNRFSLSTLSSGPGAGNAVASFSTPCLRPAHLSQHIQWMSPSQLGGWCGSRDMASKSTKLIASMLAAQLLISLLRYCSVFTSSLSARRPVGVDMTTTFTSLRMLSRYCSHSSGSSLPFSMAFTATTRISFSPVGIASLYACTCFSCHSNQAEYMLSMTTGVSPLPHPSTCAGCPKNPGSFSSVGPGLMPLIVLSYPPPAIEKLSAARHSAYRVIVNIL